MCLASQNNHPTSLASSWDISFFKSLVQQDPKGSNKVAHHFIFDVYDSPNRKYVNLSIIYYIVDFSFFMSQDDAYFHIHQNDPEDPGLLMVKHFDFWSADQTVGGERNSLAKIEHERLRNSRRRESTRRQKLAKKNQNIKHVI